MKMRKYEDAQMAAIPLEIFKPLKILPIQTQ